jgi:hypothetical protein
VGTPTTVQEIRFLDYRSGIATQTPWPRKHMASSVSRDKRPLKPVHKYFLFNYFAKNYKQAALHEQANIKIHALLHALNLL